MLYIQIPEGYQFESINLDESTEKMTARDYFVKRNDSDELVDKISVQKAVKTYLQHRKSDKATIDGLNIYYRKLPNIEATFIHYKPARNGNFPGEVLRTVKGVVETVRRSHLGLSNYGRLWWQRPEARARLSQKRLAEVMEKSQQQKLNRQHIGDSPNPT